MNVREFLADAGPTVATALPYIIAGGVIGGLFGMGFGSAAWGFRAGVILGGAVAFERLRRRG